MISQHFISMHSKADMLPANSTWLGLVSHMAACCHPASPGKVTTNNQAPSVTKALASNIAQHDSSQLAGLDVKIVLDVQRCSSAATDALGDVVPLGALDPKSSCQ